MLVYIYIHTYSLYMFFIYIYNIKMYIHPNLFVFSGRDVLKYPSPCS